MGNALRGTDIPWGFQMHGAENLGINKWQQNHLFQLLHHIHQAPHSIPTLNVGFASFWTTFLVSCETSFPCTPLKDSEQTLHSSLSLSQNRPGYSSLVLKRGVSQIQSQTRLGFACQVRGYLAPLDSVWLDLDKAYWPPFDGNLSHRCR